MRLSADSTITDVPQGMNINLGGMDGAEKVSETTLVISRSYIQNPRLGSAVLPEDSANSTMGTVIINDSTVNGTLDTTFSVNAKSNGTITVYSNSAVMVDLKNATKTTYDAKNPPTWAYSTSNADYLVTLGKVCSHKLNPHPHPGTCNGARVRLVSRYMLSIWARWWCEHNWLCEQDYSNGDRDTSHHMTAFKPIFDCNNVIFIFLS